MATKSEYRFFLKRKLASDNRWALRALQVIFAKQTSDEQVAEVTKHHNSVGFTGVDAEILSSFAKQYEKYKMLSPKQMSLLKRKIPKYWSQVLKVSDTAKLDAQIAAEKSNTSVQTSLNFTSVPQKKYDHEYTEQEFKKYYRRDPVVGTTYQDEVAVPGIGHYTYRIEEVSNGKVYINTIRSTVRELTPAEVK